MYVGLWHLVTAESAQLFVTRISLDGTALSVALRPSLRPSRASDFLEIGSKFSGNIALNKSNYRITNLSFKGQKDQGQWERKLKNRFPRTSSSKLDRFTSDQDHAE